ncbi:hypothetical protein LX64_01141 [Chitinophaga skermanii]|uniref:Uncharacterized protein n=1 Tax=Chitinophaga skermanii TaxID=331697 RepID=A0A327QV46_9BACT|nr:hypothetical protein LX64_01141 [Chitinophaga skermanii]
MHTAHYANLQPGQSNTQGYSSNNDYIISCSLSGYISLLNHINKIITSIPHLATYVFCKGAQT